MHVHVGVAEFLVFAAYITIFGFAWRSLSAYLSDTAVGKAMAYIY